MKNIEAIIFDLDGTLLNTLDDLCNSVNHALVKNAQPTISLEDTRRFVGNGVERLMESAVPGGRSNPVFDKSLKDFKEHYSKNSEVMTKPYPGIIPLLEDLKSRDCKMAVVSNKFDEAVKYLCEKYFGAYIKTAMGESADAPKKPAPDMVFKALKELGVEKDRALYVGDSEVDIKTAANAGLPCVCVSWGFRDVQTLKENGAELIINKPSELIGLINNFSSKKQDLAFLVSELKKGEDSVSSEDDWISEEDIISEFQ